jgi:Transglutaminase-like superfamily
MYLLPLLLLSNLVLSWSINLNCYTSLTSKSNFEGGLNCSALSTQKCLLLCGVCTTPEFAYFSSNFDSYCGGSSPTTDEGVVDFAADALLAVNQLLGNYFLDDAGDIEMNATQALKALLRHMPIKDLMVLFAEPISTLDFLIENIRLSLLTRQFPINKNVSWSLFVDFVLPYAVVMEPRDMEWRTRRRYFELFSPFVRDLSNLTDAVFTIFDAVPLAYAQGLLGYNGTAVFGNPITWKSSTSPAYLSPKTITMVNGGSCTGQAIILVSILRSVGIPARIAGCSQSVPDDDHHWAEIYIPELTSPFSDGWHTREGISNGNINGPFDAPSGPMETCLSYLMKGDKLNTIWASNWSSPVYLPFLWSNNTFSQDYAFVGGVNRCGAYCTAWGCGVNNSMHWNQDECGPITESF